MSTALEPRPSAVAYYEGDQVRVVAKAHDDVRSAVLSFLDMAVTSTGKATYYNTKEEQVAAQDAIHNAVYGVNRGLYTAMLTLPGMMDNVVQAGLQRLLANPNPCDGISFLTPEQENLALVRLAEQLPPQRLFKLFGMFCEKRINNKRTRRIVLASIMGSSRLPFWAVKYRMKLRRAIRHALGKRVAISVRKTIEGDQAFTPKIASHYPRCYKYIDRYMPSDISSEDRQTILECLCFILGGHREFTVPILRSFIDAHTDITKGSLLPTEVLQGIRSRYHKDVKAAKVIELTKATLTEGQKMAMQRTAERAGTEIEFDPTKQDLVKLYVWMLESGERKPEFRKALDQKAQQIAVSFPLRSNRLGVVVDTSASMFGDKTGKFRPLAIALAMRDVLVASANEKATVVTTGGEFDELGLVTPSGDTSLASALIEVAQDQPDAVFLITDGYENAPAGRTGEVIQGLRQLGLNFPIYQVSPVLSAENASVRPLAPEVSPLPVSNPAALGLSFVRALINQDIEGGVKSLLNITVPALTYRRESGVDAETPKKNSKRTARKPSKKRR